MVPSEIVAEFEHVRAELFRLAFDWQQYREMFESDALVTLMQRTASVFFDQVRLNLVDALSLRICRLLDPPKDRKFENLGFQHLLDKFETAGVIEQTERPKWNDSLAKVREDAAPIIHYRNKRLGHNDATTLLSCDAITADKAALRLAIEATFGFFNALVNVGGPPLEIYKFNDAILALENVYALERVLRDATDLRLLIDQIGHTKWEQIRAELRKKDCDPK